MADTYTAHLFDGESEETIELDLIAGAPQKSILRTEDVDGQQADVVWELESGSDPASYRRAQSEGYGEGGIV